MTSYLPLLTDDELATGGPAGEAGVGAVATERGNLPLEAVDVDATLTGLVARVVLTQTFGNRYDQPLEASYIFPLPDRAAVSEFRMELGERVVEGVLRERGQARADYHRAVREGRRASIAEEERPGVFTMRVGNLLPGERVSVRLVMSGPLPWEDGEATFRFPLVVAPRYIPGSPLEGEPVGDGTVPDTDAVPDASRITPPVLLPGFPNPVALSIRVAIDPAGLELGEVRSSLHAVVEEERDGSRVVRVEPGERANRDLVLRLPCGAGAVATAVAATRDPEGDQGTFALTLLPRAGAGAAAPPRDVVFVLDRSGSMTGWKLVAARRAVARMVDSLTERDRFLLLAFDNLVETPPALAGGLQAAGDHARFLAAEYLSRLEARGGTELAAPLARAMDHLTGAAGELAGRDAREPVLVLVTDGQVGNEDEVLRLLAPRLGGVRVYTVGVDTAVNEGFLRRLAGLGGGACELVESEDRLEAVMGRVHRRIGAPVVTGLELEPAGLAVDPATLAPAGLVAGPDTPAPAGLPMDPAAPPPRRLPDLFAGSPLVVRGRFTGPAGGAVTVRGRDAAGQPWSATVPVTVTGAPALTATWARAHLRDLEDRYATGFSPDRELERRIVETSLRFGVLCRFTAFVAVDVQVANEGGAVHRVLQPVEVPAGWELFDRVGLAVAAMPTASISAAGVRPTRLALGRTPAGRGPAGPLAGADARLRRAAGRVGPAAPGRRRSAGFAGTPLSGAELATYRHRAARLATLLDGHPGPALSPAGPAPAAGTVPAGRPDLRRRLGLVRVGLEALVADLESVGADEEELRPLRDLAVELAPATRSAGPGDPELTRLRDHALAVLLAFAGGSGGQVPTAAPGPARGRDPGFWRR